MVTYSAAARLLMNVGWSSMWEGVSFCSGVYSLLNDGVRIIGVPKEYKDKKPKQPVFSWSRVGIVDALKELNKAISEERFNEYERSFLIKLRDAALLFESGCAHGLVSLKLGEGPNGEATSAGSVSQSSSLNDKVISTDSISLCGGPLSLI